MSRSFLLLAVSGLALAACQPASEAPQDVSAETPPAVEDVAEVVEAETDAVAPATVDVVEAAAEASDDHDHDHDEAHDHADEDHAHDDDHDHDHDDHAEGDADHDDHAHEDGDHAHDDHDHDHDHAGGEAHVHGLSELAASLDDTTLSVNVEGALANFDLDESIRTLDDTAPYTDGTVEVVGGDCTRTATSASIRPIGDHGNMIIDWTFECAAAASIEAIEVTGFQSFAGFEEVNAVFLTGTDQTAETLTTSDTRLDLS
ncbi:MAG: DUF2796 domain-containing protein [Pseudomonadota bacterium]